MPGEVIGGETVPPGAIEGGDWRTQLQQDSRPRERVVNKIMETLKRHLLPRRPGQEELQELKKIAVRFERKIYTEATSLSDYLRKISLRMLTMEIKTQNRIANPLQANAASNSRNPQDPASQSMQTQVQQLPIPTVSGQSQVWRQFLSRNIQNNIPSTGVLNSAGLASALAPGGWMSQGTMANAPVQNANRFVLKKEEPRVLKICTNSFRRYSIVTLMDSPLLPSRAARRLAPQTRETPQKRAPEISPPNSKGSASALRQQVHQGSNGIAARKRMAGNGMSEDSRRAGRKQKISTGQDVSSRGISAGTS